VKLVLASVGRSQQQVRAACVCMCVCSKTLRAVRNERPRACFQLVMMILRSRLRNCNRLLRPRPGARRAVPNTRNCTERIPEYSSSCDDPGWRMWVWIRNSQVPQMLVRVTEMTHTMFGDAKLTLADPTGRITATVHRAALAAEPLLTKGAVLLLQKVKP